MGTHRAASSALAVLLAACVFIATPAAAQLGELSKILSGKRTPQPAPKAEPKSAAASDADTRQTREDITKQLAAAQTQLDALEASSDDSTRGAPPGTSASETTERLALARQL